MALGDKPAVAARQALSVLEEFRNFAFKGNVVDMAVGVIIGAAFGKIVDSLVKNILMPLVSLLIPGDRAYTSWKIVVGTQEIPYGLFLGEIVNFLIVAFALYFSIVKFMGFMMRQRQQAPAAPAPGPTAEQKLLTEIRDLLANKSR
jgi:large conductance mechanosensitive channel